MTERNDGGPVYPTHGPSMFGGTQTNCEGMSLRDYFAAHAMEGMLAACASPNLSPDDLPNKRMLALDAYDIADAMLKARDET